MLARLFCALLLLAPCSFSQPAPNRLKLVVVLSRHGVRSPTGLMSEYANNKKWPDIQKDWRTQCCADLTTRGYDLARILGAYYRSYYSEEGLLPKTGCPAKEVYIWADNEQRTIRTGQALAEGLGGTQDCIQVRSLTGFPPDCDKGGKSCSRPTSDPQDLWFHPLPGLWNKVSAGDRQEIKRAADDINNSYEQLLTNYRSNLDALQRVLGCCASSMCKGKTPCTLLDLPHEAKAGQPPTNGNKGDGTALKWEGPFAVGSTAAEVFLLEYANKMDCGQVGWGQVEFKSPDCLGSEKFREMQEIHTTYFHQMQYPKIVAQIQGSNLANQILTEILNAAFKPQRSRGKFVVFAGHDTNIANIAALLGLSWKLPDLPDDDTPPAGALVFELYSGEAPGRYSVRIRYVHQTVEQLRTDTLSSNKPPNWVDLHLPLCPEYCPITHFKTIVRNRIRFAFVTQNPPLK